MKMVKYRVDERVGDCLEGLMRDHLSNGVNYAVRVCVGNGVSRRVESRVFFRVQEEVNRG